MDAYPIMMTILLVRDRTTRKHFLELEFVMSDGELVSQRLPAERLIQVNFQEGKEKVA